MKTVQISLNSIDKVKSFVNDITKFDYDFDLVSGRYVIDAKSIMGIFSLDLSKPIDLNIHAEDGTDEVMAALKPYIMYARFCLHQRVKSSSGNSRAVFMHTGHTQTLVKRGKMTYNMLNRTAGR